MCWPRALARLVPSAVRLRIRALESEEGFWEHRNENRLVAAPFKGQG